MAIRPVITRGYGNGTFNGTIPLVVMRGYTSNTVVAASVSPTPIGLSGRNDSSFALSARKDDAVSLSGRNDSSKSLSGKV